MNALNEVNKVITSVSYYTHRHSQIEEDEWLTAEKMAVSTFVSVMSVSFLFLADALEP
jgi:ubiquitin carboxyl-terminal hydrolase 9/24